MLVADVGKRLQTFDLAVRLDVAPGATTVVVGESGAGKTTLLRLLAGLDRPDRGRITLDGTVYFDAAGRTAVPAAARDVGYVMQDYALFPHLTVHDNAAFGLRAQGVPRRDAAARADAALARLGVGDLAGRRPASLSGGQRQRVALARALALEPRLLLLDEPLSALDIGTRQAMRTELRPLLASLSCVSIYVTHSALEALALGDTIAVIERGRLTQIGNREDLLCRPRTPYVASFMGVNLFVGRVVGRTADGLARIRTVDGELTVVDPGRGDDDVFVVASPREITLFLAPPGGSAQNLFRGVVVELIPEPPFGERVRVVLDTHPHLVAEVTRHAIAALGIAVGREVYAAIKATAVVTFR